MIVQETELKSFNDPSVLAWAAERQRVLVTHDINTVPNHTYQRVRAGEPVAGVIIVPEELAIGLAIEELTVLAGETSSHVGVSILEKEPAPLARYAPEVPAELQRIVRKALAKDLNERYQTARDLLIDLKNLRRELEVQSEVERSLPPEKFGVAPSGGWLTDAKRSPPEVGTPNVRSTGVAAAPPTSSAEYLVSEIKRHKLGVGIGVATLIVAVVAIIFFVPSLIRQRSTSVLSAAPRKLWRLTFDAGLQSEPTWSPDGRFVAYSSDRSGNFDIWVKPLADGSIHRRGSL